MSSVREIARKLGISPATVSRAVNNHPAVAPEVRRKVMAVVNRSRYVPRVALRSTTNIALAYTGESSLASPFDSALLAGIGERMHELGFDLMILDAARSRLAHESFSQMFIRKGVRGALLRTTAPTRNLCEEVADEGFCAIVIGDRFEQPNVSFISSDSRTSSQEAIEHLIELGHQRIGICVNVVDDTDHADRIAGYHDALAAHNIAADERLLFRAPANLEGGGQLIRRLHSNSARPTALYMTDPAAAAGAINEAQQLGLSVPGDLSIVGFDDSQFRHLVRPAMTSVCQDAAEIAREACEAMRIMLDQGEKDEPIRRVLPTRFEVHASTSRPRAASRRAK